MMDKVHLYLHLEQAVAAARKEQGGTLAMQDERLVAGELEVAWSCLTPEERAYIERLDWPHLGHGETE